MSHRLPALVAALWWGSLTTTGFLVVPMLFAHLPSPTVAGNMAAKLFAAQTWVAVDFGGSGGSVIQGGTNLSVTCTLPPNVALQGFESVGVIDVGE